MSVAIHLRTDDSAETGPGIILTIIENEKPLAWISLQRPAIGFVLRHLLKRWLYLFFFC